jgi:hypothetical protein
MSYMANHSFLAVWLKEMPEEKILECLGAFLATVPLSAKRPGFTYLTIRAVDASETPVFEQDLRAAPLDATGIVELASEQLHGDSSYEVACHWDLGVFDAGTGKSGAEPQPLLIACRGQEYDGGFWREGGHFEANLGFDDLFTGHGLLGMRAEAKSAAQSAEELRFREAMAWPENLEKYQRQTRENIRKLQDWARRIEASMPVEKTRLWSEGEDNFEARLDEIVAAR